MHFNARGRRSTATLARVAHLITLTAALAGAGCAHPHARPKTVGAFGAVVGVVGGTLWAVGDRVDSDAVLYPGVVGLVAGVATVIVAGVMMAYSVACEADADCPVGHECKEVPARAGRIPYAQCAPP